jgi:hypothetical protein
MSSRPSVGWTLSHIAFILQLDTFYGAVRRVMIQTMSSSTVQNAVPLFPAPYETSHHRGIDQDILLIAFAGQTVQFFSDSSTYIIRADCNISGKLVAIS